MDRDHIEEVCGEFKPLRACAGGDDCLEIISDSELAEDSLSLSTLLRSMTIGRRSMLAR
jgi:hypothetical protein